MPDEKLEIGRIGAPHGLQGELAVTLTSNVENRLAPGLELWCAAGPLRVVASRPHGRRWLVRFEGCDDIAGAERLRGLVLSAERVSDDDPEALWVHELIGSRVVEADGTDRGLVVEVLVNPAADLLVLDSGALVPLTFVVQAGGGAITIDPPAGLFE